MIEFLRKWTMTLAGICVFGSLCEMLLPNSVYKKYINLAIGIMLCVSLVSPFVKGKFETKIPEISYSAESFETDRKDTVLVFSKKVCGSIEEFIKKETYIDAEVKCKISEEEESFGKIEDIYIIAEADGEVMDKNLINKIKEDYGAENVSVKYMK